MMICWNWLHLTWTYLHQGVWNCFETMPNRPYLDKLSLAHYFELRSSDLPICWQPIIVWRLCMCAELQVTRIFVSFAIYFMYLLINEQITVRWLLFFYSCSSINLSDTYKHIFNMDWTPHRSSTRKDITLTNQVLDYKDSRFILRLFIPRLEKFNPRINLGIAIPMFNLSS